MNVIPTWIKALIIGGFIALVGYGASHLVTSYGDARYKAGQDNRQVDWDAQAALTAKAVLALEKKNADDRVAIEKRTAEIVASHTDNLNTIKANYEKIHHIDVATIANLNGRLRRSVQDIANSLQASKGESGTSLPAEIGGDCDATTVGRLRHDLTEVSIACAITTADYNALREHDDANCEIFGCE